MDKIPVGIFAKFFFEQLKKIDSKKCRLETKSYHRYCNFGMKKMEYSLWCDCSISQFFLNFSGGKSRIFFRRDFFDAGANDWSYRHKVGRYVMAGHRP